MPKFTTLQRCVAREQRPIAVVLVFALAGLGMLWEIRSSMFYELDTKAISQRRHKGDSQEHDLLTAEHRALIEGAERDWLAWQNATGRTKMELFAYSLDPLRRIYGLDDPSAPNYYLLKWGPRFESTLAVPQPIDDASLQSLHDAVYFDCTRFILDRKLIDAIKNASKLRWLCINSQVTTKHLGWISELKELRGLSLRDARIEDSDLRVFSKLAKLQWLNLTGASLPDDGRIPSLRNLEVLMIAGSDRTSFVPVLDQFPKLKAIDLSHSSVSDGSIAQLVKAIPD